MGIDKRIIAYIAQETGEKNLEKKTWKEIVDGIILPKMVGAFSERDCISDSFMNFVAKFSYEIMSIDIASAHVMFEIGLQRLFKGAVPHEKVRLNDSLPVSYWQYSAVSDDDCGMTAGCLNFITSALERCLQSPARSEAAQILFGLMKHLSSQGNCSASYQEALGKFNKPDIVKRLYQHAEYLAEEYLSFAELYKNYAKPDQWYKHKLWFSTNYNKIDWKQFFQDTQTCQHGNFIARWVERRALKQEIKLTKIRFGDVDLNL